MSRGPCRGCRKLPQIDSTFAPRKPAAHAGERRASCPGTASRIPGQHGRPIHSRGTNGLDAARFLRKCVGRWPGHVLTANLRAPFIHGFIVDEWETTDSEPPVSRVSGVALRSFPDGDGAMPSGLRRFQQAQSLHFITFSCFHRLPLLDVPGAGESFEAVLEQTRARHGARVPGLRARW